MQLNLVWEIIKKDWAETFRSKQILAAVIAFPILMGVILPTLLVGVMTFVPEAETDSDFAIFEQLLPPLTEDWASLSEKAKGTVMMVIFSQLFLLFIPIMIPSTVASDTVVGEKERETIEGLLGLPLTKSEILLAKIGSSLLPSLFATWIICVPYVLIVDLLTFPIIGRLLLPNMSFLLLIGLLTPLISFISVTGVVMISSRVSTTRDAQQLSVFIVLPLMVLIIGQLFIILIDIRLIILGIIILAIISFITFKIATRIFDRDRLMTSI
ncbi:MAG: ABC transporter permease [Promethearchaeota archaeon]